jgi:holliday junction DNA helicase RuvA
MIAKLTGLLDSTGTDWLVIDVGGVGYQVFVSSRTLSQLPGHGQKLSLLIESLVRNEQTQLFGFSDETERTWFRLLLAIQGVGAKVGLAILSAVSCDELHQAILSQDQAIITRADGVGPKLANRIIAELKSKVGGLTLGLANSSLEGASTISSISGGMSEAISALTNLGYRRSEAVEAIAKSTQILGPGASTEDLIRQGLNVLSQNMTSGAAHG